MRNQFAWHLAAAGLALSATTVNADEFNTPGQVCQPYYPHLNFEIERDYARLLNPETSARIVWVTCPVESSDAALNGNADMYVNVYFAEGVSGSVTCVVRRMPFNNRFVLGEPNTDVLEVDIGTVSHNGAPTVDGRGFVGAIYYPTLNHDGSFNYTTVACRLIPGSGVNAIFYDQQ